MAGILEFLSPTLRVVLHLLAFLIVQDTMVARKDNGIVLQTRVGLYLTDEIAQSVIQGIETTNEIIHHPRHRFRQVQTAVFLIDEGCVRGLRDTLNIPVAIVHEAVEFLEEDGINIAVDNC